MISRSSSDALIRSVAESVALRTKAGVTRSMSAIGSSADNALAGSFNATRKRETPQGRRAWDTELEASLDLLRSLHHYYTARHHSNLGHRSPIVCERALRTTSTKLTEAVQTVFRTNGQGPSGCPLQPMSIFAVSPLGRKVGANFHMTGITKPSRTHQVPQVWWTVTPPMIAYSSNRALPVTPMTTSTVQKASSHQEPAAMRMAAANTTSTTSRHPFAICR